MDICGIGVDESIYASELEIDIHPTEVYISLIYLKLKILLAYMPDFTQFALDYVW